jgi:hypothetical protein
MASVVSRSRPNSRPTSPRARRPSHPVIKSALATPERTRTERTEQITEVGVTFDVKITQLGEQDEVVNDVEEIDEEEDEDDDAIRLHFFKERRFSIFPIP